MYKGPLPRAQFICCFRQLKNCNLSLDNATEGHCLIMPISETRLRKYITMFLLIQHVFIQPWHQWGKHRVIVSWKNIRKDMSVLWSVLENKWSPHSQLSSAYQLKAAWEPKQELMSPRESQTKYSSSAAPSPKSHQPSKKYQPFNRSPLGPTRPSLIQIHSKCCNHHQ